MRDRGALFALALILSAILIAAWITSTAPGNVRQSITSSNEAAVQTKDDGSGQQVVGARDEAFHFFGDSWANWSIALFSALAAGISLYAVRLVRDTLDETRKATEAAVAASAHAAKTNEISSAAYSNELRPWISIKSFELAELRPSNGHFSLDARLDVENLGKTPAIEVTLSVKFYPIGRNKRHYRDLTEFCDQCREQASQLRGSPAESLVIFPHGSETLTCRASQSIVDPAVVPNNVGVRVFACVTYRSMTGGSPLHVGMAKGFVHKDERIINPRVSQVFLATDLKTLALPNHTSMS